MPVGRATCAVCGRASRDQDHYEVLEVDRDADAATVRAAYLRAVKAWHPDRRRDAAAGAPEDAERFLDVQEAWEVLADPVARRRYDDALGVGAAPTASSPDPERHDHQVRLWLVRASMAGVAEQWAPGELGSGRDELVATVHAELARAVRPDADTHSERSDVRRAYRASWRAHSGWPPRALPPDATLVGQAVSSALWASTRWLWAHLSPEARAGLPVPPARPRLRLGDPAPRARDDAGDPPPERPARRGSRRRARRLRSGASRRRWLWMIVVALWVAGVVWFQLVR